MGGVGVFPTPQEQFPPGDHKTHYLGGFGVDFTGFGLFFAFKSQCNPDLRQKPPKTGEIEDHPIYKTD